MKRIGISILIGGVCSLLFFASVKILERKQKNRTSLLDVLKNRPVTEPELYNGKLKIVIGKPTDSSYLLKKTIAQITRRLDNDLQNFTAKQIDRNTHEITVTKTDDKVNIKKMVTESVKIEFKEVFTLNDIADAITKTNEAVKKIVHEKKNRETEELKRIAADSSENKLSAIIARNELDANTGLTSLIQFNQPYNNEKGIQIFPAQLGYVKAKDTQELKNILSRPEIIKLFPENLSFTFGIISAYSGKEDSILAFYSIKTIDPAFKPCPTGNQITKAKMIFVPSSGSPALAFSFNNAGAKAWYFMTQRNVGKPVAILINGIVITAPLVEGAIEGGDCTLTGSFTVEECQYLSKMILSEELPLPVRITESNFTVLPSKESNLSILLGIVFLVATALSYVISLLIKPASKP